MYISSENNNYPFSNAVITVTDNTVIVPSDAATKTKPRFNMLFPIMVKEGPTNVMEQFLPGEANLFDSVHGDPSYTKTGIASEMIHRVLSMSDSGVGVYVVNLCDDNAKMANAAIVAKTKVVAAVPKTDTSGAPLYLTPDGREVTDEVGNTAITRDVLHVKYELKYLADVVSPMDLFTKLDALHAEVAVDGYVTYPLMVFNYEGRSAFGNDVSLSFSAIRSEYNTSMYYKLNVVDANKSYSYSANLSFLPDSEEFFVCNVLNSTIPNINALPSNYIEDFFTVLKGYIGTTSISSLDIFNLTLYQAETEVDSIDVGAYKAITLKNGAASTATFDELAIKLFDGQIISDITSILRYRINYIVDVNYSEDLKTKIRTFCNSRIRTTLFCAAVGGTESFGSAVVDGTENYLPDSITSRLLAGCQQGMAVSPFTKRMHVYPPTYFDTIAFVKSIMRNGSPYMPFAGTDARWTEYQEYSMAYPSESALLIYELTKARINVVKKDSNSGAYLTDQMMCTQNVSDLTEFSNDLILADMIYDVVDLIHANNFTFNEGEQVKTFKEKVNSSINTYYAPYSASLEVNVYRQGDSGLEGRTNVIEITVDFKDISKFAKVEFIINDN